MAASRRRSFCVLDTGRYLHDCCLLVIHEVGISELRNINFHDVLNQSVHLCLISLNFINVYNLMDFKILQKLP